MLSCKYFLYNDNPVDSKLELYMLTYDEIVSKLKETSARKCDIEPIEDFQVDFYTLFNLPRLKFDKKTFKQAYKTLILLIHPDKEICPNKSEFAKYVNNARDVLANRRQRKAYKQALSNLPTEQSQDLPCFTEDGAEFRDSEEDSCDTVSMSSLSGSFFHSPFTGPTTTREPDKNPLSPFEGYKNKRHNEGQNISGNFSIQRRKLVPGLPSPFFSENSSTKNSYLMFFYITDGTQETRHVKASELIEDFIERKKKGTGHLFCNNQLLNQTKTVAFSFSQITETQSHGSAKKKGLIITLSTHETTLTDPFIITACDSYTKNYPDCVISVAENSFSCCCLQ